MPVTDYIGRTIDVVAYDNIQPSGESLLQQTLAQPGEGGKIITGIHKLVQRYILELLTERGSIPHLPLRGCQFMEQARLGFFQTSFDVLASFSASQVDVRQNLQLEESISDPDDERFLSAELLTVTLTNGNASVTVQVTSRAKTSRQFIMPIDTAL